MPESVKRRVGLYLILSALLILLLSSPMFDFQVYAETLQISIDTLQNCEDTPKKRSDIRQLTSTLDVKADGVAENPQEAGMVLKKGMVARKTSIVVEYISDHQIDHDEIVRMVENAYVHTGAGKEGDYIKWNLGNIQIDATGKYVSGMYDFLITFDVDYRTTAEEEAEVDERLAEIYPTLDLEGRTELEKIKRIYHYITTHVSYDMDHLNDTSYRRQYTAYAALIEGKAVCQGYSTLLYRMLQDQGMDSRMVAGFSSSEGISGNHGWNIVRVGTKYFFLDSTWDEGGYWNFFLFGYANQKNHQLNEEYTTEEFLKAYPIPDEDYETYIILHPTPKSSWVEEDGKKYYYDEQGNPVDGAVKIDGKWYFFSEHIMQTGWVMLDGNTFYMDDDGIKVTGAKKIDGKQYYFNSKGIMQTGWVTVKNKQYYLDTDGVMHTGWLELEGNRYFFASNGKMQTGVKTIDGEKYYFRNGILQTGFVKVAGNYYFLDPGTGALQIGWIAYNGYQYYARESGVVAQSCVINIDGTEYTFNKKGICTNKKD